MIGPIRFQYSPVRQTIASAVRLMRYIVILINTSKSIDHLLTIRNFPTVCYLAYIRFHILWMDQSLQNPRNPSPQFKIFDLHLQININTSPLRLIKMQYSESETNSTALGQSGDFFSPRIPLLLAFLMMLMS